MVLKRLKDGMARARKAWELAPHIHDLHAAMEEREGLALSGNERELLENAMAFSRVVADDVSTPRAEMVAVSETIKLDKLVEIFAESSHTRLPVIGKNLDDVKGFLLLKDVVAKLLELKGREGQFKLKEMIRPLPVVQESMSLPKVVHLMRREKVTMVLVVDEFGGTSGLVCLRDVLGELVGEVGDEDSEDYEPLRAMGGGRFFVRGDTTLSEFDKAAGTELFEKFGDQVETIGGAVLHAASKVPAKGDRVKLGPNVEVLVVGTNGRRVMAVEIKVAG